MASTARLVLDVDAKGVTKADAALDGLEASAKKATKATKKLTASEKQAATATEKLAKSTASLKRQVAGLVSTYLGLAAAVSAVSLVGEFEEASQTVKAIGQAAKASAADLESLAAQTRALGASTRFTATQVAEAQVNLLRAGLASNEVLASTANVLNLATAAQLELARAAEIAAITQKQFGLEASESERIVDVLVATANSAATTVEQLAEGLKFAAPVAAGFGATIEETAAALGVLSNAGLQASLAGTGLRGIFARLAAPTGMAAAEIERLARASGQLTDDFNVTKRTLREVFLAFKKAAAGPTALLKIFGRLQAPAAITLTNAADELGVFQDRLTGITGEAEKTAATINDTLKKSFLDLQAALAELVLTVNDSIGPAFRQFVEFTTDVVRAMTGVKDATGQTNVVAELLAISIRIMIDLLLAYAIQWAAVTVQTIFAKTATLGFIGALRGVKAAIASTGIGLFVVALGEVVVRISAAFDAADEFTAKMEEEASAIDEATAALKKNNEALEANIKLAEGVLTPFEALQQRIKDMAVETRKFLEEANKLQGGLELAFSVEALEAYDTVLKEAVNRGFRLADAQRIAAKSVRVFTQELEANAAAQFALERIKQGPDIDADDSAKAGAKIVDIIRKLKEEFDDSLINDKTTKRIEQVQRSVLELFQQISNTGPAAFAELETALNRVFELITRTGENKAFLKLQGAAAEASATIVQGFEDAKAALAAVGRDPSIQIAIDTQKEFAEAIAITETLLAEQFARGEISAAQADKELASRRNLINATARLRQEELSRIQALERQVELQGKIDASVEVMQSLTAAIGGSTNALGQFESAAGTAIAGYREQMLLAGADTAALQMQIDATTASISRFAEELAKQDLLENLGSVLTSTTRAFFDLFETLIDGSKTAGEAFAAFIKVVIRALFQKFVVEQTIDAIQRGLQAIGAVSDAAGGASGAISALPSVVSADGNAFDQGAVQAFRHGGVIDRPTLFPLGLAGEAGPEAILPLARGPNGQLGVQTSGAERTGRRPGSNPFILRSLSPGASNATTAGEVRTGTSRTTNVQFNVTTPDASSFRRSSRQMTDQAIRSAGFGN